MNLTAVRDKVGFIIEGRSKSLNAIYHSFDGMDRFPLFPGGPTSVLIQALMKDGVHVPNHSGTVCVFFRVGHVMQKGRQLHVPV